MTIQSEQVSLLGAGSWAVAMANLLAGNGHRVSLWEFDRKAADDLRKTRQISEKLPGIFLADEIRVTNDLDDDLLSAPILLLVVPCQWIREVCKKLAGKCENTRCIVSLTKGVEVASRKRVSEIVSELLGRRFEENFVALSGPSHAEEVARCVPTSVVAAGKSDERVTEIQHMMSTPTFRVYSCTDLVGVELGGALKNIIAIAAGILYGLELGDNAMGALLTRGLAEITRLGVRLGADPATFAGLSGIGDLVTTCGSRHSRNRYVGERIGKGETLPEVLNSMTMVAEGVETTRAAVRLAHDHDVEMPITEQMYQVLFEDKPPFDAVNDLMTRDLKKEVYT